MVEKKLFLHEALIEKPNELTFDASYSLRLSDQFSMAVALRYLRSDLKIQAVDASAKAASSFGVDIAGYYQSEEEAYSDFNGRWRGGFAIQNLGPKMKYDDASQALHLGCAKITPPRTPRHGASLYVVASWEAQFGDFMLWHGFVGMYVCGKVLVPSASRYMFFVAGLNYINTE